MTYRQALVYLGRVRLFGSKLGLENIRELTERLGRPQDGLRFIHIAGTNGKGSVAAMLDACLRAGFSQGRFPPTPSDEGSQSERTAARVGMFTSPHLVRFNERIRVNGEPIPDEAVVAGVAALLPHVEAMGGSAKAAGPTYFEIVTALALWHFQREGVEWVVWETGLGGRLDATNIVEPEACVITPIARDHAKWLGETIPQIAAEKAGILKPKVPAVTWQPSAQALAVLRERAEGLEVPLGIVDQDIMFRSTGIGEGPTQKGVIAGMPCRLGLLGPHQMGNAACVVGILKALRERRELKLEDRAITQGLDQARWPGRFDVIQNDPPFVLDGAHNVAAIRMLVATWRAVFGGQKAHLVCGLLSDKDTVAMLEELLPLAESATFVGLQSERSADPQELVDLAAGVPSSTSGTLAGAWPAVEAIAPTKPVLLTGSLYMVGEALARLEGRAHELALNEYLVPKV